MGPSKDSLARGWRWVSRVVVPIVVVLVLAEGAMRLAEPRFDRYDAALNQGDIPVLKLRAASDVLAQGGTMFVGASDAGSAFIPADVMAAAGADDPAYNAAVPGMPTDMYGPWARHVDDAGGQPDRIVVGVNPTQFQQLTIDVSRAEEEAGITIEAGLDIVRANIDRAPQYAGTGDELVDHIALLRSRQWIQHPTDAWNALTGADPPFADAAEGLQADELAEDLRPDGTNARWDEPMDPGQGGRAVVDGSAVGPSEDGAVDEWVDDLERLEADLDTEVAVVLLPFTPQLAGVAGDPDFAAVRGEMREALCAADLETLDLTSLELGPDSFSDPLHFSAVGAERLSQLTGVWLDQGDPTACG